VAEKREGRGHLAILIYSARDGLNRPSRALEETMAEEGTIYIGKKPTMNYVLAVVSQVNSGCDAVCIKARGRAISRAVDVAEIVRNRFVQGMNYRDVKIATESLPGQDGGSANVSSIEIYLSK